MNDTERVEQRESLGSLVGIKKTFARRERILEGMKVLFEIETVIFFY